MYETITLEKRDGIARITLNRPEAYNALNLQMGRDLRNALNDVDLDDSVRVVLLTGEGKAFCAGGDVAEFHAEGDAVQRMLKDLVVELHESVALMTHMDKPTVAAINGVAAGAGMSIALATDLAVAASTAKFNLAYTQIGASPDGSSTFTLPRLVGTRRAMELALLNRVLTAQEALDWGLINQVVEPDELTASADALAARLVAGPTRAYGTTKRLIYRSFDTSMETQLMHEGRGIVAMGGTEDFIEGTTAFVEKRKPLFKNR